MQGDFGVDADVDVETEIDVDAEAEVEMKVEVEVMLLFEEAIPMRQFLKKQERGTQATSK